VNLELEEIAEALYDHWKSSSYELKRQGAFEDAPTTLRSVFLQQAQAVLNKSFDKVIERDK
jgi:hypothetical protein